MELAISARQRSHGSIVSTMLGKDGGKHCRSARPVMEIHLINRFRHLLATTC
jgi:hypothetical protein